MTDLKKLPTSGVSKDDVTYLWVSHRGKKAERRPHASRKREPDPMTVPWGDIVETPLRLLRRIFDRG
jgi:hypothetical protein